MLLYAGNSWLSLYHESQDFRKKFLRVSIGFPKDNIICRTYSKQTPGITRVKICETDLQSQVVSHCLRNKK